MIESRLDVILVFVVLFFSLPLLVYICTKLAVYGYLKARKDFHEREGRGE